MLEDGTIFEKLGFDGELFEFVIDEGKYNSNFQVKMFLFFLFDFIMLTAVTIALYLLYFYLL